MKVQPTIEAPHSVDGCPWPTAAIPPFSLIPLSADCSDAVVGTVMAYLVHYNRSDAEAPVSYDLADLVVV